MKKNLKWSVAPFYFNPHCVCLQKIRSSKSRINSVPSPDLHFIISVPDKHIQQADYQYRFHE